jgi:hypothetical protein
MDLVGGDTSSTKRLVASALLFRHRLGGATRYYHKPIPIVDTGFDNYSVTLYI